MSTDKLVKTASASLAEHDIFGDLLTASEKQSLLDSGVVKSFSTGQLICQQHERDSKLYIVLLGEVEVSEGNDNKRLVLAHLGKGEVFGEISALFQIPRISSVYAAKPSVVLEIGGDIFGKMLDKNAVLRDAIIKRYGNRLIETALRSISLFRYLAPESLAGFLQEASLLSIAPGSTIVSEGELGDAMYVIIHGAARVASRQLGKEVLPLAIIGPGDYFGEWSVLTGAPRTASITAVSHVEVIRIERETLLKFIQDNPEVRDRLDQIAHNRRFGDQPDIPGIGVDGLSQHSLENINSVLKENPPD